MLKIWGPSAILDMTRRWFSIRRDLQGQITHHHVNFQHNWAMCCWINHDLVNFRRRYVMPRPWPFTPWPWTYAEDHVKPRTVPNITEIEQSVAELFKTRNTFCGRTCYLPNSQVHNDWTVPIRTVILHIFHGACTKRPYISTSGLKSDVFLDPEDAEISAIGVAYNTFKADIGLLNICMDFQDLSA